MAVPVRGLAVFVANGSPALHPINSPLLKGGDPIIDMWDMTAPGTIGSIGKLFGSAVVAEAFGEDGPQIAEIGGTAGIAGHTMLALIGVGPAG